MILDVLSSDVSQVGKDDFAAVDPSVLIQVGVNGPGGAGLAFQNGGVNTWFERGDNVILKKVQIDMPFGFGQGTGRHLIQLAWLASAGDGGALTYIPELSGGGFLPIPTMCDPVEFPPDGLMIAVPTLATGVQRVQLVLKSVVLNVSMVNIPAVLVGAVVPFAYYLEVLHTRPMQAAAV